MGTNKESTEAGLTQRGVNREQTNKKKNLQQNLNKHPHYEQISQIIIPKTKQKSRKVVDWRRNGGEMEGKISGVEGPVDCGKAEN